MLRARAFDCTMLHNLWLEFHSMRNHTQREREFALGTVWIRNGRGLSLATVIANPTPTHKIDDNNF